MRYGNRNLRFFRPHVVLGPLALVGVVASISGCTDQTQTTTVTRNTPECEAQPVQEARSPGVDDEHRTPEFWIEHYGEQAETVVMSNDRLVPHNLRNESIEGGFRSPVDPRIASVDGVNEDLEERIEFLRERVGSGRFVEGETGALELAVARIEGAERIDEWFVIERERPLWCLPMTVGLFVPPPDPAFDRNRCASLHTGELVRALRETDDKKFVYVHAGHSVGWLEDPDRSNALDFDQALMHRASKSWAVVVHDDTVVGDRNLRMGTRIRLEDPPQAKQPGPDGSPPPPAPSDAPMQGFVVPQLDTPVALDRGDAIAQGYLPLTRKNLFEVAFRELGEPYGWGGTEGERDCSRFLYDVFAVFGVQLARHSSVQAKLGSRRINTKNMSEDDKRAAIRKAAQAGIVLLYMKGHIMLYLGNDGGRDFALSSLSEYLTPCDGAGDQVHRLDRVEVTTLELGRGTARTSFIERIETLVIFDQTPFADRKARQDGLSLNPRR